MHNQGQNQDETIKQILEMFQGLSYSPGNKVNAQIIQGMLNAARNQGFGQPGAGQGDKPYSPEVMTMIKRFIQSASGGNMNYSQNQA